MNNNVKELTLEELGNIGGAGLWDAVKRAANMVGSALHKAGKNIGDCMQKELEDNKDPGKGGDPTPFGVVLAMGKGVAEGVVKTIKD